VDTTYKNTPNSGAAKNMKLALYMNTELKLLDSAAVYYQKGFDCHFAKRIYKSGKG